LEDNYKGDAAAAAAYLARSGYKSFDKTEVLTTPFSNDEATGHAFVPRSIREILPGRLFVLSGFWFTEYYFVVSKDGSELIGIDAGTRPDAAKSAYEALRSSRPNLPPLKSIFI